MTKEKRLTVASFVASVALSSLLAGGFVLAQTNGNVNTNAPANTNTVQNANTQNANVRTNTTITNSTTTVTNTTTTNNPAASNWWPWALFVGVLIVVLIVVAATRGRDTSTTHIERTDRER